jgi:hypothetical protein
MADDNIVEKLLDRPQRSHSTFDIVYHNYPISVTFEAQVDDIKCVKPFVSSPSRLLRTSPQKTFGQSLTRNHSIPQLECEGQVRHSDYHSETTKPDKNSTMESVSRPRSLLVIESPVEGCHRGLPPRPRSPLVIKSPIKGCSPPSGNHYTAVDYNGVYFGYCMGRGFQTVPFQRNSTRETGVVSGNSSGQSENKRPLLRIDIPSTLSKTSPFITNRFSDNSSVEALKLPSPAVEVSAAVAIGDERAFAKVDSKSQSSATAASDSPSNTEKGPDWSPLTKNSKRSFLNAESSRTCPSSRPAHERGIPGQADMDKWALARRKGREPRPADKARWALAGQNAGAKSLKQRMIDAATMKTP